MTKSSCSSLRLRTCAGTMLVLIVVPIALAQTKNSGKLPDDLKPSLEARLTLFTQAQADGSWDRVASMLGRYRMGGVGHHPLTPESKACIVMQMKAMPMIAFKMKNSIFITEILSLPLDKRSWNLVGEAVFRSTTGKRESQSQITAYRDRGEWFFSPPNYGVGRRSVKFGKGLSEDVVNEILTALQRALPDVAQKMCSYPGGQRTFRHSRA